jgi:hypothetical protein
MSNLFYEMSQIQLKQIKEKYLNACPDSSSGL